MRLHQIEEDLVALPHRKRAQRALVDPLQNALVALAKRALKAVGAEQVHILCPVGENERHDAAVAPVREREAGLLAHLAQDAVLGAFAGLELSADADPLVMVLVVVFLDAVEHQILLSALDIAKACVDHASSPAFVCSNTISS